MGHTQLLLTDPLPKGQMVILWSGTGELSWELALSNTRNQRFLVSSCV